MSSDSHDHSPPAVEPDTEDYSTIQKLILGIAVFVVVSMLGVGWWLGDQVDQVAEAPLPGSAQE